MASSGDGGKHRYSREQLVGMAKRMIEAFRHVNCFVFERDELQFVRAVVREAGLRGLVRITLADDRYPYIYVVKPDLRDCAKECQDKADKIIMEGRVQEHLKKQFRIDFIRQCMSHCEYEKVKEIIQVLKRFTGEES